MNGRMLLSAIILTSFAFLSGCKGSSVKIKEVESALEFDEFEREYVQKAFLPSSGSAQRRRKQREPGENRYIIRIRGHEDFPSLTLVLSPMQPDRVMVGESVRWGHPTRIVNKSITEGEESSNSPGDIGRYLSVKFMRTMGNKLLIEMGCAVNTEDPEYSYIRWVPIGNQTRLVTGDIPAVVMLFNRKKTIDLTLGQESKHSLGCYRALNGVVVNMIFDITAFPYSERKMKEISEDLKEGQSK